MYSHFLEMLACAFEISEVIKVWFVRCAARHAHITVCEFEWAVRLLSYESQPPISFQKLRGWKVAATFTYLTSVEFGRVTVTGGTEAPPQSPFSK